MSKNRQNLCEMFLKVAQFARYIADENLSNLIEQDESMAQPVLEECELLMSSLDCFMRKMSRRQKMENNSVITQNKERKISGNSMTAKPAAHGQNDQIWLNLLTIIDSFGGKAFNSCEIYAYCGLCNTTELKIFEWNCHYTSDEHRMRLKQSTLKGNVWTERRCKQCGLVIFSDELLTRRILDSRGHNQVDLKIHFLQEAEKTTENNQEDASDVDSRADASSVRSSVKFRSKRFSSSTSTRFNRLSRGNSSESLHKSQNGSRDENKNGAFYVIDNEKIYITAQFEEICRKMLAPNCASFYYCRPCWFCTNDKDEWSAHCVDSSPHLQVMEKHTNYHVVCKVCSLQLIASFKIPEAFIKYHIRVNHSYVKERDYTDYYKQCKVRTDHP